MSPFPWRFLGRWVLGTAAGIILGTLLLVALLDAVLSQALGFQATPPELALVLVAGVAGAVQGLVAGAFQAYALKTLGISVVRWTLGTALGVAAAWAAACGAQLALLAWDVGSQETLIAFVLGGFLIGGIIGLAQWPFLASRVKGGGWWIAANGAAWVAGTGIAVGLLPAAGETLFATLAVAALGAVLVGLAVGTVTAVALALLVGGVESLPRGALTLTERRKVPRPA